MFGAYETKTAAGLHSSPGSSAVDIKHKHQVCFASVDELSLQL